MIERGVPKMKQTTLIVPGYLGSEEAHWQSWLERQLPDAQRVRGIDWNVPNIGRWSTAVGDAIDRAVRPLWLVDHSFGCLASVLAAATRPGRIAGALLVAPADPDRFTSQGLRNSSNLESGIASLFENILIDYPALAVVSTNDPWISVSTATHWAQRWGCRLASQGAAGHINVSSGYGPWPECLDFLRDMQASQGSCLLGEIDSPRSLIPAINIREEVSCPLS